MCVCVCVCVCVCQFLHILFCNFYNIIKEKKPLQRTRLAVIK